MSWSLEHPIRVGPTTVAAIVETRISARNAATYLCISGQKRPRVVLIVLRDRVEAIDVNGRALKVGDVDARYPGAIGQLTTNVGGRA